MAMIRQALACILLSASLLSLSSCTAISYYEGSSVELIDSIGFAEKVADSEAVTVVEFISDTCTHCEALAPTFKKLGDRLEGIIDVFAIDCGESGNEQTCQESQVYGFPTLKIFPSKKQKNPYTGKYYKDAISYEGPQTAKAMADAALAALPSMHIQQLESVADLEAFKAGSSLPKAVLLSTKAPSPPLFCSLSLRFRQRLDFAEASENVTGVIEALKAESFPALVVLTPEGDKVTYCGKLKAKPVIDFLEEHAGPVPDKGAVQQTTEGTDGEAPKRRSLFPVQALELAQLKDLTDEEPAWLLAFFGGSNKTCAAESEEWSNIVDKLGNVTKVGVVFLAEADVAAASEAYGLDADALKSKPCSAQLLLLPFGDKEEQDFTLYQGQLTFKEVQHFALNSFPSHVLRLTEESLPKMLAIKPNEPKVVLITDKEVTPPLFAALSANMGGRGLTFYDVHSSQQSILQQMGVKKVPAVVITYLAPASSLEEGQEPRLAIQQYGGPLKYPALAMFMEMLLMSFSEDANRGQPDAEGSEQVLEVPEVSTNDEFQSRCSSSTLGLCVILLLDSSAPELDAQLAIAKVVARQQAGKPLRFLWVDAPRQAGFVTALGLPLGQTPGAVAFSGSKLRSAYFTGALEKSKLSEFLTDVLAGRASTEALSQPPSLVDGGLDPELQEAEAVEEEFDLADILAEEVSGEGSSFTRDRADVLADVDAQLQEEEQRGNEQTAAKSARRKSGKRKKKKPKAKEEL